MDSFSDSGELYTIRNQFYTNQHRKVVSYTLDQFSSENQLKVLEFQIRSKIALDEDASKLIDEGKAKFPDNESLFQSLIAFNDVKTFGTDDSPYFDDIENAENELQASLTAIYLVKIKKEIDLAIDLLIRYIDSNSNVHELEPFLILVQLYLAKGNFTAANKIFQSFQKFPSSSRDNIIYQVLESYVLAIKGETENINNSYYFYDEWLSGDFENDPLGKARLLSVLFVLTLQLKHFPEAQDLLSQIKALNQKPNGDLIANEITFDRIVNEGANVDELLQQLNTVDPDHDFLVDYQEKSTKFDAIIEKYKIGA